MSRKEAIAAEIKALKEAAEREEANSTLARFIKNFESRVYAQLSRQLVDQLFGENPATEGSFMLFDNLITWTSDGISITMTIFNEATGETTTITIPIGDFGFLLASCANWTHYSYVSPCVTNPDGDYKDVVTIIGKAQCFSGDAVINEPVTEAIQNVPQPSRYPVVAVYKFTDSTGQRKSVDGIASFSTAVTMAPETYLIRALKQSGFFKVVERVALTI